MSHKFRGESPPAFGLIWQPLALSFPGLIGILGLVSHQVTGSGKILDLCIENSYCYIESSVLVNSAMNPHRLLNCWCIKIRYQTKQD